MCDVIMVYHSFQTMCLLGAYIGEMESLNGVLDKLGKISGVLK